MEISVIIPVYNMEQTIEKSARSVLDQTWKDLELVVVDDGSTDATAGILDRMAAEDARMRVIHQKNAGVSAARNRGLEAAQGTYIAWVDGDDWLHERALELLHAAIEKYGADMAICNYDNIEQGERIHRYREVEDTFIEGSEALRRLIERKISQSLCATLVPKRFYGQIHFPEGKLFEDVRNSWRFYAQAGRVAVVNGWHLYNRLVRENSISHARNLDMRVSSAEAYLERQRMVDEIRPDLEPVFVRANHGMILLSLRAAVFRDGGNYRKYAPRIRAVAAYFRSRRRMALGEGAGLRRKLEYAAITSGRRAGFYLSRLISLRSPKGTWLERE